MVTFKSVLSLYAAVAFVYTTTSLVFIPLGTRVFTHDVTKLAKSFEWPFTVLSSLFYPATRDFSTSRQDRQNSAFLDNVPLRAFPATSHNKRPFDPFALNETLFLSRAFSQAMHPSMIVPFYYRASGSFQRDDITIATLVTGNRFEVLGRLVQRYQGPISVAIHVTDHPKRRLTLLKELHDLYTTTPNLAIYLDVHLILDVFERQFNIWRNVARFFAAYRTDFVMLLDVDFAICTDFRSRIRNSVGSEVMQRLNQGTAALVVPAFEYTNQEKGLNESTFPRTKEELLSLVNDGEIAMFHASWGQGHNSTNYKRYYTSLPGEVYKVVSYQQAYEPYIIFRNTGTPWCDERFIGYGGNKAACLFEMYISGMDFFVLSDDFIIHQSHTYAEQARRQERKYNRKIYADYREEICFRYLRYFLSMGTLDTAKGYHLQSECRKIKGFAKIAAELISTYV